MKFNLLKSKILTGALALAMTVATVPGMAWAQDTDATAETAKLEADAMMKSNAGMQGTSVSSRQQADEWSTVTVNGITVSVSTTREKLLIIQASPNQYNIESTESGYFPQNFSMKVSPVSTVTGTNGATFAYYNAPYGVVTMGSTAATLSITNGSTNITLNCPAPVNSQGGTPTSKGIAAYLPAAGQFTNSGITAGGWGDAFIAGTNPVLKNIVNSNSSVGVSLGAFGGYLVLDFGVPAKDQNGNVVSGIYNDADNKYGIDFILYGNAMANWAEPGCVQVSENGINWYDIAGSLHYRNPEYSEGAVWDYSVKYINTQNNIANDLLTTIDPQNIGVAENVPFTFTGKVRPGSLDDISGNGNIFANSWHQQCYFPLGRHYFVDRTNSNVLTVLSGNALANLGIAQSFGTAYTSGTGSAPAELTLKGVKLNPNINTQGNPSTANDDFLFGYADSHQNGNVFGETMNPYEIGRMAGGDPIDLDWAVNADGTPIHLDSVRFVRVYTAVQQDNGMMGESSTEITGAYVATEKGTSVSYAEVGIFAPASDQFIETAPEEIPELQIGGDEFTLEIQSDADIVVVNGKPLENNNGTFIYSGHMENNTEELTQIIMQTGTSKPEIRIIKLIN